MTEAGEQGDHIPLATAILEWDAEGQPLSSHFEDVYFSRTDGRAETTHVFINGNRLEERWSRLTTEGGCFTIGETGFGTGLNFLLTARLWLEHAPANWQLHFISCEKHPLTPADFRRGLILWPDLADLGHELATLLPLPLSGSHRRTLADGRIRLTLLQGDAAPMLNTLADGALTCQHDKLTGVDAWFLDGFAPAKNSEMWTPALYEVMARLSRPHATIATFTAAGHVRRGLAAVGFTIEKKPGFGTKRDMTSGHYPQPPATDDIPPPYRETPWFIRSSTADEQGRETVVREAVVIGAGIAGCATAATLAQRGWQVTLMDRQEQPGAGASGNPQGILYPRLSRHNDLLPRFSLDALLHACAWYTPYWQTRTNDEPSGVLLLPEGPSQEEEFSALATRFAGADLVRLLEGSAISQQAGISLAARRALYLPGSGWIVPPDVCQWLAHHPRIRFQQAEIDHLDQDQAGLWHLWSHGREIARSPVVVLANAAAARLFPQTAHLPLRVIRGQISSLTGTPELNRLRTTLCGKGYLAPARNGVHTLGATYNIDDTDTSVRVTDHFRNLETLSATDPALRELLLATSPETWDGRAALRCTSPDYLPLVGPAPDREAFLDTYAALRRDARRIVPSRGPCHRGLFIHCALGSRGFTYAPLGAEYLADLIDHQLPALSPAVQRAIHPARFLIRDLKRKRL